MACDGTDTVNVPAQFDCFGSCQCQQDLTGNFVVNAADLALLLGAWGANPGNPADFDGNGVVNAADLASMLGNWGPC